MQTAGGRVHPSRAVSWVCGRHWATAHLLPVITTCRVFEEFILLLFPEIPRRYHSSLNSLGVNNPFITIFRLHILGDLYVICHKVTYFSNNIHHTSVQSQFVGQQPQKAAFSVQKWSSPTAAKLSTIHRHDLCPEFVYTMKWRYDGLHQLNICSMPTDKKHHSLKTNSVHSLDPGLESSRWVKSTAHSPRMWAVSSAFSPPRLQNHL